MHGIVGDVLGVKTQIVFFGKRLHGSLGGGVQTDLEGGAVLDEPGDVAADLGRRIGLPGRLYRYQRLFVFHNEIHIVDMDEALAQHPGHAWVDLGDDMPGGCGGRQGDVHRNPQAHPAEIVGGRHLHQGHVDRQFSGFEQARYFGHVHRRDKALFLSNALGFRCPQVDVTDAQAEIHGAVGDFGQRRGLLTHHANDLKAAQPGSGPGQGADQLLGLSAGRTDENTLTWPDAFKGLGGRAYFLGVVVRPV